MAKTKEKAAEAVQAPATSEQTPEQTQAPPGQASTPPEQTPQQPQRPKERHVLLSILTMLLLVVGIGELAVLGLLGFRFYQGRLALRQYEASRSGDQSETAQAASMASYSGPWLKIENGQVVWRWEDELPSGDYGGTSTIEGQLPDLEANSVKVLASPGVPLIRYRLAEEARLEALQRLGYIN